MIELGGNIKLDGFRELDPPSLIIIKKLVGNYAKRIGEDATPFSELMLQLKESNEKERKHTLVASLITDKKKFSSESTEQNLFFAIDTVLNGIYTDAKK